MVGTTLGQQTHGHEQEHHLADNRQHISTCLCCPVTQSLRVLTLQLGHVTRGDDTWSLSTGGDLLQPVDGRTCVPSIHSARLCKHEHRITLLYAQLKENVFIHRNCIRMSHFYGYFCACHLSVCCNNEDTVVATLHT